MPTLAVCLAVLLSGCGQAGGGSGSPPRVGTTSPAPETTAPAEAPGTAPDGTAPVSGAPTPGDAPATPGNAPATPGNAPAAPAPAAHPAPPDRLLVPSLGLDEELIDLGLAPDGSMEVPEDADRAGWFTGGGRPGGRGPTVLAGHVDSSSGPAVFGELTVLGPGDEVVVESVDGGRVSYRVDRVADYPKGTFPTEEVFGATPADELRLITCTGAWDSLAASYEDNRVVFATAVRS